MRILVVNWQDRLNPQAGGAEVHLHEIFGRMARIGDSVTLLASGWKGAPPRDRLDGIEVHRTGGRYTFNLAAPSYFRRVLRGRPFDVVVEDLNKVPLFTPFWTRAPICLLVHHLFGATAFREASLPVASLTWLLERPIPRVYRNCPVVAVSKSTAEDLRRRGLSPSRIEVIYNGIDLDVFPAGTETGRFPEPTLLYLGRLKRYKGVDLLIRSVDELKRRDVFVRLLIAGKGDYGDALVGLRDQLGIQDRVDFLGFVADQEKVRLLQKCWIHLLTSPKEGWGISNLEAAACGTPTVASDSPGLHESVRHGETGFLVPHGDVAALADRIQELIVDESLRIGMGRAARAFSERFSWDQMARSFRDVLLGCIDPADPPE